MRIMVIGAGSIGQRHHGNLGGLGAEATLVPYRAFQGAATLDAQALDGVVIATATQIRLELVRLCAERGLPFYVEKPLAYDPVTLASIMQAAGPVADRCLVGFMMRYHPAFRYLARLDLTDVFRFSFEIGHDVRQWRLNWSFADSYAARADGGGVLLDLCHELDMAATLFPGSGLHRVDSLGHADFPGVDFATRISLGAGGSVAMDYLAPSLVRRAVMCGTEQVVDFDFAAQRYLIDHGNGPHAIDLPLERNAMFIDAMRDFLALVGGGPVSEVEHLPRLDRVGASCALLAKAWETRQFGGNVTGEYI